jgi:PBP1b-binding outer membrane lipoprotein LpoB
MIRVILFTVVTLFIVGCGNDVTQNTKAEVKSKQEVKEEVKVTIQDVKDVSKEIK